MMCCKSALDDNPADEQYAVPVTVVPLGYGEWQTGWVSLQADLLEMAAECGGSALLGHERPCTQKFFVVAPGLDDEIEYFRRENRVHRGTSEGGHSVHEALNTRGIDPRGKSKCAQYQRNYDRTGWVSNLGASRGRVPGSMVSTQPKLVPRCATLIGKPKFYDEDSQAKCSELTLFNKSIEDTPLIAES